LRCGAAFAILSIARSVSTTQAVRSRNRRLARERFEREMNAESSMAQKESISSLRQRSIVNIEVAARLVICGQPDKSRDIIATEI
jgi:hypothetical protein